MGIRFEANSSASHPEHGVLLPPPFPPRGYVITITHKLIPAMLIIFYGNNGVDTATVP